VIIIPTLPGPDGDRFRQYARANKFIELLQFPPNSLHFQAPQSFVHEQPFFPGAFKNSASVFLYMNNRSLLYDPVDWPKTKQALSNWLSQYCPAGKLVPEVDEKFGERIMSKAPPRLGRSVQETCPTLTLMSAGPQKQCQQSLRKRVGKNLKQVNTINCGNRQAATIGLFPYALERMVKDKYPAEGSFKMDYLSRNVIRACAARFREYQRLTALSEALRTAHGKPNLHKCQDPFHFLDAPSSKSKLRATCHCDRLPKSKKRSQKRPSAGGKKKIKKSSFSLTVGPIQKLEAGLDYKHNPRHQQSAPSPIITNERTSANKGTQKDIQDYLVIRSSIT
jgi:hypothetical protein